MSFKIVIRVLQANPNAWFHPAEQTVWKFANGGTWSVSDGEYILTMGGSGTSGCVRFVSDTDESFVAAFGVHKHKRWCDIVTDLGPDETALAIHPRYYEQPDCEAVREKQRASCTVCNVQGRNFTIDFPVADGFDLKANIIIG